jgi:hypothetical protein
VNHSVSLTGKRLRSPKAAAVAGILFAILLISVLLLFRSSVPRDVLDDGAWLSARLERLMLAINLMPFAGIAFLWFIGVVRDRMADTEDRLFATVFLGSGLLFLAMMFVAVALFGAMVAVQLSRPGSLANSTTFALARALAYTIVNVYAIKMAGVFMLITSTIAVRTAFVARWLAVPGFVMALFLLFASQWVDWSFIVFPAWALLISVYILIANLHRASVT